jgi:hypothetical protein
MPLSATDVGLDIGWRHRFEITGLDPELAQFSDRDCSPHVRVRVPVVASVFKSGGARFGAITHGPQQIADRQSVTKNPGI